MAAYITVGAKTSHGGTVISGSPHTTHNGIPVARKGDKVICKKCKKVTTIVSGDASFIVDGAPIARGGDVTSCGAKLIASQQSFAESGFDVGSIAQAAPLQFAKSDMSNSFVNKNSDESSSISLIWVNLNDNQFVPLNAPSYDSNSTDYGKIVFTVAIKEGSYKELKILLGNEVIASKKGDFTPGKHVKLYWDGFVKNIYDSTNFTDKAVVFTLEGNSNGTIDRDSKIVTFENKYKWLDVKINKVTKRIDAILRVSISSITKVNVLPLVVPLSVQQSKGKGRALMNEINITNNEIETLIRESITRYWSRNSSTLTSKISNSIGINIFGSKYEVFTTCKITDTNSLPTLNIKFNTNRGSARSRNWEGSRIVFYNMGYIKYESGWSYITKASANRSFKKTFAHELGHEILLAYGGHSYSKEHKGSSSLITQKPNASYQHIGKEYDLMQYDSAKTNPTDIYDKLVASDKDVRGLLWLSMIATTT